MTRFHSFLLFLGQPSSSVRDIKVTTFCRIVSEFSLEYRTTRERVLTLRRKRAAHRERTKTRGKMITEVKSLPPPESSFLRCFSVLYNFPSYFSPFPTTFRQRSFPGQCLIRTTRLPSPRQQRRRSTRQ